MVYEQVFKPNRTAFVIYAFVKLMWAPFLIMLAAFFLSPASSLLAFLWFLAAFILFEFYGFIARNVSFKKERYVFSADRMVRESGGIFSNSRTELVLKNVTQVIMRKPWLENNLFGTGNIHIEAAGSGTSEIVLKSVDNPEKTYAYIEKMLQYAGFKLTKKQLVQQERPSSLGVFFETSRVLWIGLVVSFHIFIAGLSRLFVGSSFLVILAVLTIACLVFTYAILRFLDLKSRIYKIYADVITYEEGFLTKESSLIPIENLSDSEVNQSVVDKIFGLYDVVISCQGSKNKILFKNIANGPQLESSIDSLIAKSKSLIGKKPSGRTASAVKAVTSKKAVYDTTYTAQFSMDTMRTLATSVFLPIVLLLIVAAAVLVLFSISSEGVFSAVIAAIMPSFWLIFAFGGYSISRVIKMLATKYEIKPGSIEERYDFLSSKHKEFTNEKIMGVVFKESFIDLWFGTCSINFLSIGSSEMINFSNIKKTPDLYGKINSKLGIKSSKQIYAVDSLFNFPDMIKANLFGVFSVAAISIGLVVAGLMNGILLVMLPLFWTAIAAFFVYLNVYYKNSHLRIYEDYAYFTKGVFFKSFYFALSDNIKDVKTIKYPASQEGAIIFNVAGEQSGEKTYRNSKRLTARSNGFRINYVPDIETKDEIIDLIFYLHPSAAQVSQMETDFIKHSPNEIIAAKPDVANSVFAITALSVLIFPFIILLPITVPVAVWSLKVKSYVLQNYRIVAFSGIIYKSKKSILLSKVDHINNHQDVFNKMFGNGSITVNTTGSSTVEMSINDIKNYSEFYEVLKKHY